MAKDDKQTKPYAKDTYDKVIEKVEKAGELQTAVNDLDLKSLGSNATNLKDTASDLNRTMRAKTSVNAGKFGASSIIGKASKNLFEFPVFISTSVSLDYATAVNALLEQIYASYLQMAISMDPVVSAEDVMKNRVFQHYKTDTTKFLEYTDMSYSHDACHNVITDDNGNVCEFTMVTVPDKIANLIVESANYEPLSEFDHFFQEAAGKRKTNPRLQTNYVRARTDAADKAGQAATEEKYKLQQDRRIAAAKEMRDQSKEERDIITWQRDEEDREQKRAYDAAREKREAAKNKREEAAAERDYEKHSKDMMTKAPQLMDETKIQKLNSMKPLMMTVDLKVASPKGRFEDVIEYMVGVKTHCRLIKADVLPEMAQYPLQQMNKMTQRAKWRAGEIKLLDYLFSRPEKMQAAYDSRNKNKKWYHRLYTLAHAKGSRWTAYKITGTRSADGLIPDCTIVVSKSDVDNVLEQTKIDLLKASTAARLCSELFLMAFIVVDVENQSVKMLMPDINKEFEVHSMASLNKQLATLDVSSDVARNVMKTMMR